MTKKLLLAGLAAIAVLLLVLFSPLRDVLADDRLLAHAQDLRGNAAAPLLVPAAFVVLSLVFVPLFVLRATIVLAFGPILGPVYAILAVALAAFVGHALGRHAGAPLLERLGGERVRKIAARLSRCGVWSIAALRLVPLGPNMLVNAVAGAARTPRPSFVVGTVIGMMPGLLLLAGLGAQLEALIRHL